MTDPKRKRLLDQARVLYAEGAATSVIARAVGVAPATVRRWARKAAQAGAPWQREARPRPHCNQACRPARTAEADLRHMLEQRLADLVARSAEEPDKPGAEDRMLKVCKVLEFLRGADDLEAQLRAIKGFAAFCVQALSEDEMAPVRKAIHLFLEKLRRENA